MCDDQVERAPNSPTLKDPLIYETNVKIETRREAEVTVREGNGATPECELQRCRRKSIRAALVHRLVHMREMKVELNTEMKVELKTE